MKELSCDPILELVTHWARSDDSFRGLLLIGSHARGEARPDSDIDFTVLCREPQRFRLSWWHSLIEWWKIDARQSKYTTEHYGLVWSRRLRLEPSGEIELGFALLSWADVSLISPGTRKVMAGGYRILYDPDGALAPLGEGL